MADSNDQEPEQQTFWDKLRRPLLPVTRFLSALNALIKQVVKLSGYILDGVRWLAALASPTVAAVAVSGTVATGGIVGVLAATDTYPFEDTASPATTQAPDDTSTPGDTLRPTATGTPEPTAGSTVTGTGATPLLGTDEELLGYIALAPSDLGANWVMEGDRPFGRFNLASFSGKLNDNTDGYDLRFYDPLDRAEFTAGLIRGFGTEGDQTAWDAKIHAMAFSEKDGSGDVFIDLRNEWIPALCESYEGELRTVDGVEDSTLCDYTVSRQQRIAEVVRAGRFAAIVTLNVDDDSERMRLAQEIGVKVASRMSESSQ